mmetsp:Transcript_8868/g.32474  ORF Transcript_8868/g.32474 Transcript_8868/m.32474 type:complete len:417 (+) Transcript_8868:115-1365(+)|eukprot:25178-Pelagococcus_subviridis.AAC.6
MSSSKGVLRRAPWTRKRRQRRDRGRRGRDDGRDVHHARGILRAPRETAHHRPSHRVAAAVAAAAVAAAFARRVLGGAVAAVAAAGDGPDVRAARARAAGRGPDRDAQVKQRVAQDEAEDDAREQHRVVRHADQHEEVSARDLNRVHRERLRLDGRRRASRRGVAALSPAFRFRFRPLESALRGLLALAPRRRERLHGDADRDRDEEGCEELADGGQLEIFLEKDDARAVLIPPPEKAVHVHGRARDLGVADLPGPTPVVPLPVVRGDALGLAVVAVALPGLVRPHEAGAADALGHLRGRAPARGLVDARQPAVHLAGRAPAVVLESSAARDGRQRAVVVVGKRRARGGGQDASPVVVVVVAAAAAEGFRGVLVPLPERQRRAVAARRRRVLRVRGREDHPPEPRARRPGRRRGAAV